MEIDLPKPQVVVEGSDSLYTYISMCNKCNCVTKRYKRRSQAQIVVTHSVTLFRGASAMCNDTAQNNLPAIIAASARLDSIHSGFASSHSRLASVPQSPSNPERPS